MMNHKLLNQTGLVVLGAILLTACGPAAPTPTDGPIDDSGLQTYAPTPAAPTPGDPTAAPGLDNTKWKLIDINGAAVDASVNATMAFAGSKVSGSGGCNSYGGTYKVVGSTITFSEVASTLMACDDPKMQVETAFLGALQGQTTFSLSSSGLIIAAKGATLNFALQP